MPIVKIWPVKADYGGAKGKVAGIEGLKNVVDYVSDAEKVVANNGGASDGTPDYELDLQKIKSIYSEKNFGRVINYVENEHKTEMQYVSSYLCSKKDPAKDFCLAAEKLALKSGNKIKTNSGALAYHLVQSFPEDLDISDEEVHQCGIELVKKLGKYQAFICSHVHPVLDEEGELHGKAKHNHILINAYMHPDFYDPKKGGPGKYNDSVEAYRALQIMNDEISIDHGLPIIRSEDMERVYSWKESNENNKGTGWKARLRQDIEIFRRVAEDWNEFTKIMIAEGYRVNDKNKHTVYVTPNGKSIRAGTLGQEYTKETLEMFWAIRDHAMDVIKTDLSMNDEPILSDFIMNYDDQLSLKIPLGYQGLEEKHFKMVPLNKDTKGDEEAFRTYLKMDELYDICDETGQPVITSSGMEIFRSIEDLRDEEMMARRALLREEEEKIREARKQREQDRMQDDNYYYYNPDFRSSRTGKMYCCSYYDQEGYARGNLELAYVLALVVLQKEAYLWVPRGEVPEDLKNEPFFAKTNHKIQNMIDSIEMSRKENIMTPAELDKRLNSVGAAYSRSKKMYNDVSQTAQRMENLANAVQTYRKTQKIVEGIDALPEGEDKEMMRQKYSGTIDDYKAAKRVMHVHKTVDEAAIVDFETRYEQITKDVSILEARMKEHAEHYRNLKKLNYNLQLAKDPNYIYGPSYPGIHFKFTEDEQKELGKTLWYKLEETADRSDEMRADVGQDLGSRQRT